MVKRYSEDLDRIFFALSDPTRRAILMQLSHGAATVFKLGEPFSLSPPAVTKHLKLLESANLVVRKKQGKLHYIHINPEPVKEASQWIAQYTAMWNQQLDNLEAFLSDIQTKEKGET